jgi:hypothetical protein
MVYLGPVTPRPQSIKAPSRPSSTTAVRAYASDQHGASVDSAPTIAVGPPGGIERRKQDRRGKSGEHMVETRTGKDRRRSPQTDINISI